MSIAVIPPNTATAALRRISFTLVDETDKFTPEDITVTGVKVSLAIAGGTPADSTNDIVKVDGTNGEYYLELTQAESNQDAGTVIRGWLQPTGCALTKIAARIDGVMRGTDGANTTAPLDAAGIRTAVGLASGNLDTQLADLPTVAEFEARTLAAAAYFDPTTDAVTVGTNNDKTGYALASAPPTASAIASQVRTELTTELARIDAAISTRSEFDAASDLVSLDLSQTGITFRDVSAVTDEATITVADCFAAAFVQTAGDEGVVGTTYTKKRPAGTAFRTFTLDDGTTPTERS